MTGRPGVGDAWERLLDVGDRALRDHGDQLDKLTTPKEGFGKPSDWQAEVATFFGRVVRDASRAATVWWGMVEGLADPELGSPQGWDSPPGQHQRTVNIGSPTAPLKVWASGLRRLGEGATPSRSKYRIVCDPDMVAAGGDGVVALTIECGGMPTGIYFGNVETDQKEHGPIPFSVYVSEVDTAAASPG